MERFFPLLKKFLHLAHRQSGARVASFLVSEGKAALEALARSMRTAEGSTDGMKQEFIFGTFLERNPLNEHIKTANSVCAACDHLSIRIQRCCRIARPDREAPPRNCGRPRGFDAGGADSPLGGGNGTAKSDGKLVSAKLPVLSTERPGCRTERR